VEPEGIAWDAAAGAIAVGVRRPAQLVFVAPASLRVIARVPLPAPPRHLSYDAAERAVLVPAEAADQLLAVRPGGIAYAAAVGNHPHDAAAVGKEVFVADEHSDQVSVLRHGRPVATLRAPHQPGGIAAVGDRRIALVAVSARVLQIYDAHPPKPLGEAPAGVGPSHIVAGGETAYAADTEGEAILVFAVGGRPRLVGEVAAAGTPYGMALDPARDRLWVTDTATNRLTEYSTRAPIPRRLRSYPTLRQPNSVAVDPRDGTVFVAGRTPGRLQRIDPSEGSR
jgi:DNA-binding beta-propeller fold protein YncE